MRFTDRVGLPPDEWTSLQRDLAPRGILADVLAWAHAQQPPWTVHDVVIQDEYTHDVVLRGPRDRVLVMDTT